jgi:hypothetical protein
MLLCIKMKTEPAYKMSRFSTNLVDGQSLKKLDGQLTLVMLSPPFLCTLYVLYVHFRMHAMVWLVMVLF